MSAPMTTKFCTACANPLIATAVICPKCGSPVGGYNPVVPVGKSKTTAVLLAVFLGIWSWLYTYKVNRGKFWFTLGSYLFSVIALASLVAYVAFKYRDSYYQDPTAIEIGFGAFLAFAVQWLPAGYWIWAIIDNSVKPSQWYSSYMAR